MGMEFRKDLDWRLKHVTYLFIDSNQPYTWVKLSWEREENQRKGEPRKELFTNPNIQ